MISLEFEWVYIPMDKIVALWKQGRHRKTNAILFLLYERQEMETHLFNSKIKNYNIQGGSYLVKLYIPIASDQCNHI